ncbi:HAMP domain-containing protein [Pedobacter sp. BS3]|uniref:sensor histidine kinase n=1 Tax=Pedobacter sp. BS3 TaxID=2567937 RepID=UPI0011EC9116|nr:ATP-binding protein [Pedobacter sp. BS3]TZF83615.1 HAMP domain-containing protein [Pedobacter sp. BS3]
MKIKDRLSLYFTLLCGGIMVGAMIVIYFVFSSSMKNEFSHRLKDRTMVAARLYLEADEISSDSLDKIRERYLIKIPGEVIRIYDSRNAAAFIPDKQQYWDQRIIEEVRKKGYIQYSDNTRQVVGIYYHDNQGNFVILASASDAETVWRLNRLVRVMALVFVLVSILIFISGRWLARKMLSPLQVLIKKIRDIRVSSLDTRIYVSNQHDEIGMLAQDFNHLLDHLQNAFEMQRTFVANASHELRTPVTTITGQADVALLKERNVDEYKQVLQAILAEADVLQETISGLMELAQIDMNFTAATFSDIRIDDVVWQLQDEWNSKQEKPLLLVEMNDLPSEEERLTIQATKTLLVIAFNNIIGNALKFSNHQPVTLSLTIAGDIIEIAIRDQGIGIRESDITHLFEPFYRAPNARTYSGSGIGLYVTGKIVHLFRGTIQVSSVVHEGTVITVRFTAVCAG